LGSIYLFLHVVCSKWLGQIIGKSPVSLNFNLGLRALQPPITTETQLMYVHI